MKLNLKKVNTKYKKGMTLLEVLLAMVMLSIIIIAFFPLFTHTARTISNSGRIIDASYVASSVLEEMYNDSKDPAVDIPSTSFTEGWYKLEQKYYVTKDIKVNGRQVDVIVRVYTNDKKIKLESQMELHLLWKEKEEENS